MEKNSDTRGDVENYILNVVRILFSKILVEIQLG